MMRLTARENICVDYLCNKFRWVGCSDELCPDHCMEEEAKKEKKE